MQKDDLTRRSFLAATAIAAGTISATRSASAKPAEGAPFSLPPLAYPFDALEPHIDKMTMEIHHGKHHAAYVTNLNKALESAPDLAGKSLDELLAGGLKAVAFDQAVQVVTVEFRIERPGKLDGTQHRRAEFQPGAAEFVLEKTVVETCVVGDEQAPVQALQGLGGNRLEGRRVGDHLIADAGELLDEGRDARAGIDQLLPFAHLTVRIDLDNPDLGDAVGRRGGAGGFEIDKG